MKITSLIGKNNRVQIFIDENYSFSCTENFVIDNRLFKDKELDQNELEILKSDAQYSIVEMKMFEYASRGLYSQKELIQKTTKYCRNKFDFTPQDEFFKKVIAKLERLKVFNTKNSIRYLTQKYISQSKGKTFIFSKLISKGFDKSEIQEELNNLDIVNLEDKLEDLINKKFETLKKNQNLNKYELKQKVIKFALSRGYSYSEIKEKLIGLD